MLTLLQHLREFGGEYLWEKQKGNFTWRQTSEKLHSRIDTRPLPEIYNAIYYSTYESASINKYE